MFVTRNKGEDSFKNSLLSHVCDVMCWVRAVLDLSCGRNVLQYCCCLIAVLTAWKKFMKISHRKGIVQEFHFLK